MDEYIFSVESKDGILMQDKIKAENESFTIGDIKYKIQFGENNMFFSRETSDSSFIIKLSESTYSAEIYLKNERQKLNIPIEFINYEYSKDGFKMSYKLLSQEERLHISFKKI